MYQIVTPEFKDYYDKNWHAIKEDWVTAFMNKHNFNIVTNNRLESINGKIKQVVQKNSTLVDFIVNFFKWLNSKNFETDLKISYSLMKKPFTQSDDPTTLAYRNLLTDYAFNLVIKELKTIFANEELKTKNLKVTVETCFCSFYTKYLLPCRFIFYLRKNNQLSLFLESACNFRWTKKCVLEVQRNFNKNRGKLANETSANESQKKKTLLKTESNANR